MAAFLQVRNLRKSYTQGSHSIEVLRNVSLEMERGQSLSILGTSGVGKSTLLHCLGLLDRIDSGEIEMNGEVLSSSGEWSEMALRRRQAVGFVFQFHYLMAELTAQENVMIPLLMQQVSAKEAAQRAREILNSVGLSERLSHRPSQLSGGEQQRVAIARALIHRPKLILADEPTGNLDPKTAASVFEILKSQCQVSGAILIMATHNHDLARKLDRVVQLSDGELC